MELLPWTLISLSIRGSSSPGNTPTWRWTSPKIVMPTSSPTTTPVSSWLPSRVRPRTFHPCLCIHSREEAGSVQTSSLKLIRVFFYKWDGCKNDARAMHITAQQGCLSSPAVPHRFCFLLYVICKFNSIFHAKILLWILNMFVHTGACVLVFSYTFCSLEETFYVSASTLG